MPRRIILSPFSGGCETGRAYSLQLNSKPSIMKTYYNGKEITSLCLITLFVFLLIYSLVCS